MAGDIYYFTIHVPDVERGRRVYGELLGWKFDDDPTHGDDLSPAGGVHGPVDAPMTQVWFHVPDVAAAVSAVRANGGTSTDVMESPSGWHADCDDGAGTSFSMGNLRPGFAELHPPSTKHGNIGYFVIPVRDLDRGKRFFAGVLGWEYAAEHSHATYAHVGNTAPGGGLVVGDGSRPEVWFRVDDIHAAVAKVEKLGGKAKSPSESGSGWSAACTDDQGAAFNLWKPAPGL